MTIVFKCKLEYCRAINNWKFPKIWLDRQLLFPRAKTNI